MDGKTDPDYSRGNTCSNTDNDYPPWWMVDLGEQYDVTQVAITNKNKNGDYSHFIRAPFFKKYFLQNSFHNFVLFGYLTGFFLKNFHVTVGDDVISHISFDPENFTDCVHVPGAFASAETRVLRCDRPMRGRYVAVYIEEDGILSLCEVEVFGRPVTGQCVLG